MNRRTRSPSYTWSDGLEVRRTKERSRLQRLVSADRLAALSGAHRSPRIQVDRVRYRSHRTVAHGCLHDAGVTAAGGEHGGIGRAGHGAGQLQVRQVVAVDRRVDAVRQVGRS